MKKMSELFTMDKDEFIRKMKESPTRYECMECGCHFYGKWHSNYSKHKVKCPICMDDTDPHMIMIKPE